MRALRNLGIFLVALLVLYVALDVGVRILLEHQVESRIESADDRIDVADVGADVGSFPFLVPLVSRGEVNHLGLRLEDLVTPGVTFNLLEIKVDGLTFDRSVLLNTEIKVQHLDRASIKAEITEAAASDAVGVPVTFHPGQATVTVAGQERAATVAVADGDLTLSAEGVGVLTIPLSESNYFPCTPQVDIKESKLVVRCTADQLPPALRPYLGGAAS